MSLGDRIRDERVKRGWSQATLAEKSGVSRPTIARVELGHDVSTATLSKIAAALDLSIELSERYL